MKAFCLVEHLAQAQTLDTVGSGDVSVALQQLITVISYLQLIKLANEHDTGDVLH